MNYEGTLLPHLDANCHFICLHFGVLERLSLTHNRPNAVVRAVDAAPFA